VCFSAFVIVCFPNCLFVVCMFVCLYDFAYTCVYVRVSASLFVFGCV
jgi:hypothetical protein